MTITIKMCDVCHLDIRSDSREFFLFSTLEGPDGNRRDACADCVSRLESAPKGDAE